MNLEVSIRPQCDSLGYESETYAIVDVALHEVYYQFRNVALINHVNECGLVDLVTVCSTPDDDPRPEDAEVVGQFHVLPGLPEGYELALANFLLNSPQADSIPFDVC